MTREEAIKHLYTYSPTNGSGQTTYKQHEEAKRMAIDALKKLEQGNAVCETCDPGWIPCSERLPEEHEWVGTKRFGTTISDKVHITFDVNGERFVKTLCLQNGELSDYEKRSMDAFYKGWKMLAWMPLPEPYKEEQNNE